jgi:nicotinamide-nucleotide amidase
MSSDAELADLAKALGDRLRSKRLKLAVAESCTGGWIAKSVTDVAGSSQWFDRGFVVYSNRAKTDLLGVAAQTLLQFGAVSEQVATEMAQGALAHSHADLALAITGIAGPDGGSPDKPVGLVWLATRRRGREVAASEHRFAGDRDAVRRQAVGAGLQRLIEEVDG